MIGCRYWIYGTLDQYWPCLHTIMGSGYGHSMPWRDFLEIHSHTGHHLEGKLVISLPIPILYEPLKTYHMEIAFEMYYLYVTNNMTAYKCWVFDQYVYKIVAWTALLFN